MLYTCGVYAFLFTNVLAQIQVTSNGTADSPLPPGVATPSSGVTIDTDSPPVPSPSSAEGTALPAAEEQRAQSTAGSPPERVPAALLKRSNAPPGAGALRGPPWYRSSLVVLAVVLGIILAVSYVVRRYVPAVRTLGDGALKVVQRMPLSSKQSIALVQVGRRMVLIGITPDRVSSLSVIDDPEECAHLRARVCKDAKKPGADFDVLLSAEAGKFERQPLEAALNQSESSTRLRETRGHLEGMLKKLEEMRVE